MGQMSNESHVILLPFMHAGVWSRHTVKGDPLSPGFSLSFILMQCKGKATAFYELVWVWDR